MAERVAGPPGGPARVTGFGILGPLEIRCGHDLVDAGDRRQRMVLALLLLEAGQWLSADRMIELIWPAGAPRTARNALQVCVSRLRATLGDSVPLVTAGGGYRLEVAPDLIDANRFRAVVIQAREAEADAVAAAGILDSALALWRGPVLADTFDEQLRSRLCGGLEEARLTAIESRADALLRLGRHGEVASGLTDLVSVPPVRERLVYQLMLALYRDGQAARALEVCRRVRSQLATELGIDPGPELDELEVAILRNSADLLLPAVSRDTHSPRVMVPAQLPAAVRGFTGRGGALAQLDEVAAMEHDHPLAGRVAALVGIGGIGKTVLAVQWAHRRAAHFPDGQLFADLRGYSPLPVVRPLDVLVRFLRALGVAAEQIPHDEEAAGDLYRTCVSGRRMLVVLDNVADAVQVRPLLPGTSQCMTIVTSRNRLSGLVARDAAVRVALGTLDSAESLALLTGIVGKRRMAAEPEAAAALGGICAGLPLALRIAGATLAEQPDRPVADYVAALRTGDRVAALAVPGDEQTALTATFDLSYERLAPDARQLLRLLSLVPGTDVSVEAAAALSGADPEHARRSLLALAGTHLCDETAAGRYGLHDLLRDYAAGKAHAEETAAQRAAASDRLFSWYLHTADAAGRIVAPRTVRLPLPPRHAQVMETVFAARPQALAWLDAERPNLIAAIRQAAARGPLPMAWLLPDALDGYLGQQEHTVDRFTAARESVAAATEADVAPARAAAHIILGRAHHAVGEDAAARTEYLSALGVAERLDWPQAKATALVGLGAIAGSGGPVQAAVDYFSQALTIRRAADIRTGQADLLANIGRACVDLAELDRAKGCCERALAMYQEESSPRESHGWYCLGCARHALGDLPGAQNCFARARDLDRELGTPSNEARELAALAVVALDRGRGLEAHRLADLAVGMARDLGDPEVECIALVSRAETLLRGQRFQPAADEYQDAVRIAEKHGIRLWQGPALVGLGFTALAQGDAGSAARLATQALDLSKQVGHRLIEAPALRALSESKHMGGDPAEARRYADEALAVSRDTGQRMEQVRALMTVSRLSHQAGSPGQADRNRQAATALATELGMPEPVGYAT